MFVVRLVEARASKKRGNIPLEGHDKLVGAVDEVYALARLIPVQMNSGYMPGAFSWGKGVPSKSLPVDSQDGHVISIEEVVPAVQQIVPARACRLLQKDTNSQCKAKVAPKLIYLLMSVKAFI